MLFIGSIIYVVIGIICAMGLFFYIGDNKQVKCKACRELVSSSSLKCNYCGTFLDEKIINPGKIYSYMESRVDRSYTASLKQLERDKRNS